MMGGGGGSILLLVALVVAVWALIKVFPIARIGSALIVGARTRPRRP
jgi:hypothetical protein